MTSLRNSVPDYCSELLSDMATALKGFDCCALKNARPFTVCVNCAAVYQKAFDLFDRFVNVNAFLRLHSIVTSWLALDEKKTY